MSARIRMPSVSFVVARSEPGHVIGVNNQLPWRLKSDVRYFKNVTTNHVVIMGRRTFDSIGRPLPNRINVVLSSRASKPHEGVYYARSDSTALYMADLFSIMNAYSEIFVIGGAVIFDEFPFNKIHLTEVLAPEIKGDTYFRHKFDMRRWHLERELNYPASEGDEYPFSIKVLKRKDKTTFRNRTRDLARFFTVDEHLAAWEAEQLSKLKLPKPCRGEKWVQAIQLQLPQIRDHIVL
jgi:dihydrofolate reductase